MREQTLLKIHTIDGITSRIDLEDEGQAREWLIRLQDATFQKSISGVTIAYKGVQYSLPRPHGFGQIFFHAEYVEPDISKKIKGGERLTCVADGVRIALMVHRAQKAVRVSLFKTGKQRFNPFSK
jgi:hypothetical protein